MVTDVRRNPEYNLHPPGKEVLQAMINYSMLADASHVNERTFWGTVACPSAHVIITYSNAGTLCDHPRNLWGDQVIAIAKRGGIIGMNSTPAFVHGRFEKHDIPHLAAHIHYIKRLIGIEALALGLDYMDFYEDCEELYTKSPGDCPEGQRLIERMLIWNFSEEEARLTASENTLRKLREVSQRKLKKVLGTPECFLLSSQLFEVLCFSSYTRSALHKNNTIDTVLAHNGTCSYIREKI